MVNSKDQRRDFCARQGVETIKVWGDISLRWHQLRCQRTKGIYLHTLVNDSLRSMAQKERADVTFFVTASNPYAKIWENVWEYETDLLDITSVF